MPIDRPVRVGVQVAPQHASYSTIRDSVARLEDMGVDIVFNWDHFYPLSGDLDGQHYEAWTMLGAIAEQTSRVEFGPLVNCNSYRNPDLQGDMARTLDHISGGRFIFGTGSGWNAKDYANFGYDFGTAGTRLDALAVDLPRVKARWEVGNPAPTRKIPILIGGGGERKTLKIVAEHADIWHSFSDADTLVHKLGVLRTWCDEIGRDIDEIELSTGVSVRGMGSVDQPVLEQQYELGVRLFELGITAPDYDYATVQRLIDWRDSVNG
ncbi:LLM class F420-dependent oxidoreductase [soil metagenome]